MRQITVIMKPTSECNLRCRYCYHANTDYETGIMTEEVLDAIISKVQSEYNDIVYVWHGGEPLLCGLDFFRKALQLEHKYIRDPMRIRNCIQTNGILLSKEVLQFCLENRISVTVSLDGPGKLNGCRQQTDQVERNLAKARESGVPISMLSVINRYNVDHMIEIYRYAQERSIPLKMNPVFKVNAADHEEYLIDSATYVKNFQKLFDYWLCDSKATGNIEPIMQFLRMYFEKKGTECIYGSCLYHWISFMQDGSIYPCGRTYPLKYQLGNITEVSDIQQVFETEVYRELTIASILRRQHCAEQCSYFGICNGGCNSSCLVDDNLTVPNPENCEIFQGCYGYVCAKLDDLRCTTAWNTENVVVLGMLREFMSTKD